MPKIALAKVAKKIRKKRGGLDNLGDREVKRYNRASLRDDKLKKQLKVRNEKRESDMIRTGFFKVATKDAEKGLELEEIRDLIDKWVDRNKPELERFESERRPGRPRIPKHQELINAVEAEKNEYVTGFYMPDLQDFDNIISLQRWDGNLGSLAQVKFTRVPKDDPPVPVADKMEM
ncbi:translation machinery-associated protein 16 [Pyronema domesticum]|nr:translation machinery-associated protein 16 [Pyronema domesticum]